MTSFNSDGWATNMPAVVSVGIAVSVETVQDFKVKNEC